MLVELLRLAAATAILVVLPGWLLVKALFPHSPPHPRTLRVAERVTLTLAGGILLLMLVASILGFLPYSGTRGHFQSLATGGMPNVELSMLAVMGILLWVGLQRGAFPRLAARFPRLAEPIVVRKGAARQ